MKHLHKKKKKKFLVILREWRLQLCQCETVCLQLKSFLSSLFPHATPGLSAHASQLSLMQELDRDFASTGDTLKLQFAKGESHTMKKKTLLQLCVQATSTDSGNQNEHHSFVEE